MVEKYWKLTDYGEIQTKSTYICSEAKVSYQIQVKLMRHAILSEIIDKIVNIVVKVHHPKVGFIDNFGFPFTAIVSFGLHFFVIFVFNIKVGCKFLFELLD